MCRLVLLVLIAFSMLSSAGATAATKQPALTFLGYSAYGISNLDAYKGYYESPRGTLHIVNARAGTTRVVALPDGCENRGISGPEVLLGCGDSTITYRVWDSWTGNATEVDLSACGSYARKTTLGGIGRYWIAGRYDTGYFNIEQGREFGYEVYRAVYISRRTGECRVSDDRDFNRDLDLPNPPRLRYGVPDRCTRGKKFIRDYRPSHGTYVKRCTARARWRRVTRGDEDLIPGPNLVAWITGVRLHTYFVANGRRLSWRVPGASEGTGDAFPRVIGDRVYVDVEHDDPNGIPIYVADLSGLVRGDPRLKGTWNEAATGARARAVRARGFATPAPVSARS